MKEELWFVVQLLCVMKVKENVPKTNNAFFFHFNSGLMRPANVCVSHQMIFGIGPNCLPHIRAQIFGELCSVPFVSPSEVVFRCVCFLILLSSPLPHLHHQYFFPHLVIKYIFSH